jgi:hypothetical protein
MSSSTPLGPPAVVAALPGGGLAVEGLLTDVLAFGLGHAREECEEDGAVSGRVVDALGRVGEEFELDVVVAQAVGGGDQELGGAAAQALHLSVVGPPV